MNTFKLKLNGMALLVVLISCTGNPKKPDLQNGDLLFQGAGNSRLSNAIDQVTQTSAETHFSHVGLLETDENGQLFVLHAAPETGTCRVSLTEFLQADGEPVETVVYRPEKAWQKAIPQALKRAHSMLGKPYNFSYVLSDSAHYCSEFIYKAFAADGLFTLNPMSFKDPTDGSFLTTWVDYYAKLGIAIPEGEPGCNPNGLAASDRLERIGTYQAK
ncbi:MAG: YiiX/YebB-like N1pC/P60 family cysteine hydrolase [Mangrovibacterium sp.]